MAERERAILRATAEDAENWRRWRAEAEAQGWSEPEAMRLAFRRWLARQRGAWAQRPPELGGAACAE